MWAIAGRDQPRDRRTEKGRSELLDRLRAPKQAEITDHVRFNTVLAFLRHLPDPAAQAAVLRPRIDFLEAPSGFFYRDGEPVRAAESRDLFREGIRRVARATGTAERAWRKEAIERLAQPPS